MKTLVTVFAVATTMALSPAALAGGHGGGGHGGSSHSSGGHGGVHGFAHHGLGGRHFGSFRGSRFFGGLGLGLGYGYGWPYYGSAYYGQSYYEGEDAPSAREGRHSLASDVQAELADRGFYHGEVDGILGPMSREAIRQYQARNGLPVTGEINERLLRSLGND